MKRVTFGVSAMLAVVGMAMAISGIQGSDIKALPIGLVLLFGAGVFAILAVSLRRADDTSGASALDE
jgi:hypothetical protein